MSTNQEHTGASRQARADSPRPGGGPSPAEAAPLTVQSAGGPAATAAPLSGGPSGAPPPSPPTPRRSNDEISLDLLRIIQDSGTTDELVRSAVGLFQRESGFEAVGIRIRDGFDYPYYEARGFSAEFVTMEYKLCSSGPDGEPTVDENGRPVLACTCGKVLRGEFDRERPFITARGSFWMNSTAEVLSQLQEGDLPDTFRGRCIQEGYESIALIPLAIGPERLGLLQLNDHRPGLFTVEAVEFWERLADYLAVALSRLQVEEAHRRGEEALRRKQEEIDQFFRIDSLLCVADSAGYFRTLSGGWEKLLGYSVEELTSRPYMEFVHPEDRIQTAGAASDLVDQKQVVDFVNRYIAKDGSIRWLSWWTIPAGDLVYGTVRDITERKQAEEELNRVNRTLMTLYQSNAALVRVTDEAALVQVMCDIAVNVGGYALAWVGMVNHEAGVFTRPVAWAGEGSDALRGKVLVAAGDSVGPGMFAVETGRTQVVDELDSILDRLTLGPVLRALDVHSSVAVPLSDRGQVYGVMVVYSRDPHAFVPEEVKLLEELVGNLSFGITSLRGEQTRRQAETDLRASLERFEKGLEDTIVALVTALESRDTYTAGHQRRVAELAEAVGKRLGLSDERVRGIFWAATLHDIGKLQVPQEILSKPRKLTEIEMAIIRTHSEAGYQILKGIDFPWPIAQMVLDHHERLDGSGYPNGLSGDQVSLEARILAVADAVEARTSHRPYRPARDPDEMWVDMTGPSAAQFDQAVVTACREVFVGGYAWTPGDAEG